MMSGTCGIDVFLGNAGTDFASLVEAFARFEADGGRGPRPLVVPHEFVAVSMAHGYYAAGGRPAAVMVHVNVGTGNASTAIITAARANVPILMSAGRTPVTEEGLPGSRDLHIHWAQESFDQAAMLREYVKWDYELRTPIQVEAVVDRAVELMHAEPRGPVYLTLPREVLAASPGPLTITSPSRRQSRVERFPDPARIDEAARILARAEHPLVLVSAAGLDPRAVAGLVELAEAGDIGVVEADPIYSRYPMRSYPCDVPIAAAPAVALPLLAEAVRRHADPQAVARRRARVGAEHRARHAAWEELAVKQASASTIGFAWASRCIGELVDDTTVVVNEYPLDRRFAPFTRPGSYFGSPHSSGLGFGLGAALGVKLARPESAVVATVGDGAYFFGEPLSCLFVQRAHAVPILTVIYNNQQWEAVKSGTLAVHPTGTAKTRGRFPLSELTPSPRFEEMAKTVDGYGERVESPGELPAALKRGLAAVREGRPAILNVLCQRAV